MNHPALSAGALAERTAALCRIPSVTGDERALCDYLEAEARARGAAVHRVGQSLVIGALDDPRPTLALVAHLDTVPAHPDDGAVRTEGEKLYGLGASDMKGGLAVALALGEVLPLGDLPIHLLLVLYDREEGGYAENGLEPLFAAVPALSRLKLAVCLEPTDGQLQLGCVGGLQATVTFHGTSAHSARPWQGENAIHRAGELLTELHGRERVRVECAGLEFFEVMSATLAKGGTARNVVPDRFELNLNTRFAPGKTLDQAESELRALVAGRAEVLITDRSPSGRVCLDHGWVRQLAEGSGLPITSKQAWTDVARFGARGIDAINFGPGATAQAHQAHEWVEIAALERGAATLASWILNLR